MILDGYLECGTVHMPSKTVFRSCVLKNCNLSMKEGYYFQHALNIFSAYTREHPLPTTHRAINIVITDSEEITFSLRNEYGVAATHVIIRIDLLRKSDREHLEVAILIVMLEELCHALYFVFDEVEVKKLVIEIAKFGGFDINPREWYRDMFP